MWYILDCEEDAFLYYGFSRDITKKEFEDALCNNTFTDLLNKVPVHKGDVFFIPSGTVHAIGAGIVICEIQQNSNTTYRVYDYNRRDKNGNTRPLHIKKAAEVSCLEKSSFNAQPKEGDDVILVSCPYFTVRKVVSHGKSSLKADPMCFQSIIVTNGSCTLTLNDTVLSLVKGDSVFIPAQEAEYIIEGKCELIISYV